MNIEVHPLTGNPTKAWNEIFSKEFRVSRIEVPPTGPVKPANHVRIVCISDTHNRTDFLKHPIPNGDILIHGGDFTFQGQKREVEHFYNWIGSLPHQYKIVIAGNHELSFDKRYRQREDMSRYLTNCIYLEDSGIKIMGLKFWGTPYQPGSGRWAFNEQRGVQLLEKWNLIPADTDVLVTHSPPLGIGDFCRSNDFAGDVEMFNTVVRRLKLKLHVFGHIHEGYGVYKVDGCEAIFVNASICDISYNAVNPPVVFDLPVDRSFYAAQKIEAGEDEKMDWQPS